MIEKIHISLLGLNRRSKIIFLAALAVAAVFCIRAAVEYHAFSEQQTREKLEEYRTSLSMVLKKDDLAFFKAAGERRLAELEKGLLKADKPSTAAAMLQEALKSIAVKRGISVISEKALASVEDGSYVRVPIEVQFAAELPQIKELLYEIQSGPSVIGVKALRIRKAQSRPGKLEVTIVIEGAFKKTAAI